MVNDLAREQAVAALSGPGVGVAISAALKWSTIVRQVGRPVGTDASVFSVHWH